MPGFRTTAVAVSLAFISQNEAKTISKSMSIANLDQASFDTAALLDESLFTSKAKLFTYNETAANMTQDEAYLKLKARLIQTTEGKAQLKSLDEVLAKTNAIKFLGKAPTKPSSSPAPLTPALKNVLTKLKEEMNEIQDEIDEERLHCENEKASLYAQVAQSVTMIAHFNAALQKAESEKTDAINRIHSNTEKFDVNEQLKFQTEASCSAQEHDLTVKIQRLALDLEILTHIQAEINCKNLPKGKALLQLPEGLDSSVECAECMGLNQNYTFLTHAGNNLALIQQFLDAEHRNMMNQETPVPAFIGNGQVATSDEDRKVDSDLPSGNCDENVEGNGVTYSGCQDTTINGHMCMTWTDAMLALPGNAVWKNATQFDIGDHNNCRNPTNTTGGIWCFWQNGTDIEQDFCNPKAWPALPTPMACAPTTRCSFNSDRCQDLQTKFDENILKVSEDKTQFESDLAALQKQCELDITTYRTLMAEAQKALGEAKLDLQKATQESQIARAAKDTASTAYTSLTTEFHDKDAKCCSNINDFISENCAIRKIRDKMAAKTGYEVIDCEFGDWQEGSCSKTCNSGYGLPNDNGSGLGKREDIRDVLKYPTPFGEACPPLKRVEDCNDKPCPVDCVVGDWSPWSGCSAICNGGTRTRTREVTTEAKHGGNCPELSDMETCGDRPCLTECLYSPWVQDNVCSMACDGGFYTMTRQTTQVADFGTCKGPWKKDGDKCNTQKCKDMKNGGQDLFCSSAVDVIFLMDASGSMRQSGWDTEYNLVKDVLDHLELKGVGKGDKVRVNVIAYSGPRWNYRSACKSATPMYGAKKLTDAECGLVSLFDAPNDDIDAVKTAFKKFEGSFFKTMALGTDLIKGLQVAEQQFDRPTPRNSPQDMVIFCDGHPTSKSATIREANRLKDAGKKIVSVEIGYYTDSKLLRDIASDPKDTNHLKVNQKAALIAYTDALLARVCTTLVAGASIKDTNPSPSKFYR